MVFVPFIYYLFILFVFYKELNLPDSELQQPENYLQPVTCCNSHGNNEIVLSVAQPAMDLLLHATVNSPSGTGAGPVIGATRTGAAANGSTETGSSSNLRRDSGRELLRSVSTVEGGSVPKMTKKELKLAQSQLNKQLTQINIHLHGKTGMGKDKRHGYCNEFNFLGYFLWLYS